MDKYIGNKKSIIENLEEEMAYRKINSGVFFDAFSGTNNVSQYFKQRGFEIITSDINSFSYALGVAYIENNSFPTFKLLIDKLKIKQVKFIKDEIQELINQVVRRIKNEKIFLENYLDEVNFEENIISLAQVIWYLNNLNLSEYSKNDSFFIEFYSVWGSKSEVTSLRKTTVKRNYFSKHNAMKLGIIMNKIKEWKKAKLINKFEEKILITTVIEEVTLVANVAGTFHDFNRNKLYPNAVVDMKLRIPLLNISNKDGLYHSFKGDSNSLYKNTDYKMIMDRIDSIDILYIDPPYNFRQYSDYYHFLNLIADYCDIESLEKYGENLEYIRGQNMKFSVKSQYSYKDTFTEALTELISNTRTKHVIISYYDENNHWNHGKTSTSMQGRMEVISALENSKDMEFVEALPVIFQRSNYQSRSGEKKKTIDELLFYGRKKL
ncbi:DNA adenine methylase [Fundicoccus ignavus]|uniref:site-specific DNA-methyltransferase (adenine-specific) n=1 Tax=Fundicoccus ignavus TaxID=2664442 RepID=A0A844C8M8_9LACT|nr:DNA adenine methylase [Fundicoccus ignavus]MRJ47113.1 hypothetical protein [Fundicoccus ignavus]